MKEFHKLLTIQASLIFCLALQFKIPTLFNYAYQSNRCSLILENGTLNLCHLLEFAATYH